MRPDRSQLISQLVHAAPACAESERAAFRPSADSLRMAAREHAGLPAEARSRFKRAKAGEPNFRELEPDWRMAVPG